jgi:hypothetical protein
LFRGHVFNLSTEDGYFTANGLYTGNSDSIAVHGQIRLPGEPFDTWYGKRQSPPDRPNDREIVVPHRIAWPIPPELRPRGMGEVVARWRREGRKGSPPAQPLLSTVPLERFGRKSKAETNPLTVQDKRPSVSLVNTATDHADLLNRMGAEEKAGRTPHPQIAEAAKAILDPALGHRALRDMADALVMSGQKAMIAHGPVAAAVHDAAAHALHTESFSRRGKTDYVEQSKASVAAATRRYVKLGGEL